MRNLTLIYILALTIIGFVIGVSQYLVQKSISESRYDSRTINISGRQSMLSQKITKAALAMETAPDSLAYVKSQSELKDAGDLWELSHNALQYGSQELQLNDVNNSEETLLLFLEVEPHFTAMENAIDELLIQPFPTDSLGRSELSQTINILEENEDEFLKIMNEITLDYDKESTSRVQELSRTEYLLLFIALGLLIMEGLLIFRPAIKRINDYTQKLLEQEATLKLAFEEQQKEKAKVDFLNNQAKSVFDNVKQGLFLIDQNFVVSELHSTEMERILGVENVGGVNFINLMRNRLVKRDQDALEMFVKHLFNPDIDDSVLAQLNPIDQVEIFESQKGNATIESSHLKFSFARIWDKVNIQSVLVNASDETQAVIMQKRMTESEERNKRESEQLLSILRVDTILLNEFLKRSKTDLNSISNRYETDKVQDFHQLLNYTFNVIHNLKGNASLVELHLVADRLNNIEEIILKLREKQDLQGSDFLKILYEISELNQIISNMDKMMARIAEVNEQLSESGVKVDVDKYSQNLFESIKNGLMRISKDQKKPVEIQIEGDDTPIPKQYHLSLRDIVVQLFRNSLAHGIESQHARVLSGKTPMGQISISLFKKRSKVCLTYQDDGKGLDLNQIANKALKMGIIKDSEIGDMNESDLAELIFEPGMTTSLDADQLSGRGQGLNFVREVVEGFQGSISFGKNNVIGFSVTIELPLHAIQKLAKSKV